MECPQRSREPLGRSGPADNLETALISGAIGILLGGMGQVAVSRYLEFKEGKAIAEALRAEIDSVLRRFDRAGYVATMADRIQRLEGMTTDPTFNDVFAFPTSDRPFQVFDSLCGRVGLLGDAGPGIVNTYVVGKAFITNVSFLRSFRDRMMAKEFNVHRQALLQITRDVAGLLNEFIANGTEARAMLVARRGKRWLGLIP